MTECKELFYDKDKTFLKKSSSLNYLLGFKNGVYDLKREEFEKDVQKILYQNLHILINTI